MIIKIKMLVGELVAWLFQVSSPIEYEHAKYYWVRAGGGVESVASRLRNKEALLVLRAV